MAGNGRILGAGVSKFLDHYSQFMPTPLSIQHFLEFGKHAREDKSFIFLRKELPVRLSNIMKEINLLPEHLLRMPSVKSVNQWYIQSFQEIITFEKEPVLDTTLQRFCETLVRVRNRHSDVVPTMAQGVLELKQSHPVDQQTENYIQYFLDRFYMSRISIRMLINQHTLLFDQTSNTEKVSSRNIGCLDPSCNIKTVVLDAYENAKFLCDQYYMASPELVLNEISKKKEDEGIRIVYVPSHLFHMLFELFKNSMRAVLEHHGTENGSDLPLPPITATIVKGKEDICLKISDLGGGIARSDCEHLFKYMYTTAPKPSPSEMAPFAGFGYGLPISRLYARYFNGNLNLMSCDGLGTDAIIYLKVRDNEANELLPVFNKNSSDQYKKRVGVSDWSNSNSNNNRGRPSPAE